MKYSPGEDSSFNSKIVGLKLGGTNCLQQRQDRKRTNQEVGQRKSTNQKTEQGKSTNQTTEQGKSTNQKAH